MPHYFSWGFFIVKKTTGRKLSYRQQGFRGALALALHLTLLTAAPAWTQAATTQPAQKTDVPIPAVLEVTDETGRQVKIPQAVGRIVSLAPSLTETIYALGAQDRLVGVTDYCDYPPEAQLKPKIGGPINPNLEQLVALKPDLVLVTKSLNRRETVEALDRLGIATYATDPHTVEGMLASTARLAELIGAREQGEALVAGLRARLAELKRLLATHPARRVLFVVWREPLISIGRDTFLADALRLAGAESVVDTSQDWPRLALEEVVRLQPDYLVFASSHADERERNFEALRERPGWRSLEAVRQRRLAVISDAVNRPSPQLVAAIEELARQLHPEAFDVKPEARDEKNETRQPKKATAAKHWGSRLCGR